MNHWQWSARCSWHQVTTAMNRPVHKGNIVLNIKMKYFNIVAEYKSDVYLQNLWSLWNVFILIHSLHKDNTRLRTHWHSNSCYTKGKFNKMWVHSLFAWLFDHLLCTCESESCWEICNLLNTCLCAPIANDHLYKKVLTIKI